MTTDSLISMKTIYILNDKYICPIFNNLYYYLYLFADGFSRKRSKK